MIWVGSLRHYLFPGQVIKSENNDDLPHSSCQFHTCEGNWMLSLGSNTIALGACKKRSVPTDVPNYFGSQNRSWEKSALFLSRFLSSENCKALNHNTLLHPGTSRLVFPKGTQSASRYSTVDQPVIISATKCAWPDQTGFISRYACEGVSPTCWW